MPGENIYSWSSTAASNGNADSLINWQEGQARASVNDSARSMMAAHAKKLALENASIVTTGSTNTQAFNSGFGFTFANLPTGLRVLLKIGPGLTNTGATTLNVDGIGNTPVKYFGQDLRGGELLADTPREFLYDGTNWHLLSVAATAAADQGNCRLSVSSTTQLLLDRYGGRSLFINGRPETIPFGGVTLSNGGLAADAVYDIYAYMNGATMTLEASGTGRATDATYGHQIKSGDATRTLVGKVRTVGSLFMDSLTFRCCINWFNRRPIYGYAGLSSDASLGSAPFTEVSTGLRVVFVAWGDDAIEASFLTTTYNNAAGINYAAVALDGTQFAIFAYSQQTTPDQLMAKGITTPSEGSHYITGMGGIGSAAGPAVYVAGGYTGTQLLLRG